MAKFDIYNAVTERIISQLEKGVIPWQKPWAGIQGGAISGTTGKPYSLLNQMLLGKEGEYYTFNQVVARGGVVRKGEKSQIVVFWKQVLINQPEDDSTKEPIQKSIPMLRYYNVFHIDQCDGLKPHTKPAERPICPAADRIIKEYSNREIIEIRHQKGDEAYYSPTRDCIVLPLLEQFLSGAEYYSTVFHEMAHSTGHISRLNRLKATAHFGSAEYSKEELTAEISAAALLNYTGTETKSSFRNNTAYIQNWLQVLKNDRRLIVTASGAAAKAVDYILNTEDNAHEKI